jgi:hypothetical protein
MGMCSELITSATMSVTRLDNAPTTVTTLEKSIAFLVFGSYKTRCLVNNGSSPNNDDEVFKCGDFRTGTTAIITVSAFLESVKSVRSKLGINFGAI